MRADKALEMRKVRKQILEKKPLFEAKNRFFLHRIVEVSVRNTSCSKTSLTISEVNITWLVVFFNPHKPLRKNKLINGEEVPVFHPCSAVWWLEAAWKQLYVLAATVVVSCVQLHSVSQESLRIQQRGWADLIHLFRPVCHYFSGHVTTDTAKRSARNQRIFFPTACNGWKTTGWGWYSGLLDSHVSWWLSAGADFCQEYLSLQCCHQMKIAIFSDQLFV